MKQTLQESRWVGRVLRDKWRIDRKIARGGMGTVFAATHKNNGSRAAIKVLHPEYARDADTKGRFLQEGYAANQVGHSGVVRILDDDTTEDGLPFIVMELLEGELLEQRRIGAGGKLPYEDVQEIGSQLIEVMVAAHAKGIVHRDIKPDNIFVTNEGYLKVLDFGFARMRDSARKEHTATGFLLGTPGFMSPEQASGTQAKIDARTDIWAIGATLFVLLTGQPVHEGETAAEMLVQAANFAVRPIGELEPGLPMKFRALVDKALAFDRNDRFTDAKSMLDAIRALPSMRLPPSDEDGRTLMRRSPNEADHEDRTVMGRADDATMQGRVEELEPEAIESLYTPTSNMRGGGLGHPADTEQSTLAIDPHAPTMALAHLSREQLGGSQPPQSHLPAALSKPPMSKPPTTAKVQKYVPQDDVEDEPHDHTVMMVSRPQLQPRPQTQAMQRPMIPAPQGSSPQMPAPTPRPAPSSPALDPRVGSAPSYPDLGRASQPSPSQPQMMPFAAHAHAPAPSHSQPMIMPGQQSQAPAPAKGGGIGSVLVFIAVAGITMVVVILTGLVVIVGTE